MNSWIKLVKFYFNLLSENNWKEDKTIKAIGETIANLILENSEDDWEMFQDIRYTLSGMPAEKARNYALSQQSWIENYFN